MFTACCYVTCFFVVFIHQQAAEAKNGELEGRIGSLQVDIDDSRQKQGNMKGELKKFMDILDGKIDELHEFRQGLSKLGVDNWERGGTESKGSEVRYEGFTTVCLQGRNYVAPPPPEVTSTQKLSALASNKHYHVRKICFGEGERAWQEEGQRSTKWLHFVRWHFESHSELTYPFLWEGGRL